MNKAIMIVILCCYLSIAMAQPCGSSGPSVCTPVTLSHSGFSPPYDSLPPVIDGVSSTTIIEFQNYDTIIFQGHPIIMDSLQILQITNLPVGLCWATNKATNTFKRSENGCIRIEGTTNAAPGQYQLDILVNFYSSFPINPLTTSYLILGYYYFIRVNCSSLSPIVSVDTTQERTSDTTILYPNGGDCSGIPLSINIGSVQTACTGTSLTLFSHVTGGHPPYTYFWNTTGNSLSCDSCANPITTVTQNSDYTVTVTDSLGNSANTSHNMTVLQAPLPQTIVGNPSIVPLQFYIYLVNSVSGVTDNWIVDGGAIQSGQGTNSINVGWGATGPYRVELIQTNQAGCTDTSYLEVEATGIPNISDNEKWKLFPNPAREQLTLGNDNLTGFSGFHIKVINALGQTILSQSFLRTEMKIDVADWPRGVYFVCVQDANLNAVITKRVVIQ